jgi:cysteine desulfurase/selenocysteine lyase
VDAFKKEFAQRSYLAFNNAGVSPICQSACLTLTRWAERFQREGINCFPEIDVEVERTRSALGQLLGCSAEQIAFFSSTATAISQVALGYPLKPGDEILLWDQEYPSSFYPWVEAARRRGARVVIVPSADQLATPAELMLAKVTARTRIMAFSWVQYRTGAMADLTTLTEFAKTRDIFTCADVIQGVGVLPFDFAASGLDAACGGSHKWLFSPLGVGYLLLAKSRIALLEPLSVGAMSFGTTEDTPRVDAPLKTTMARFEPGAKNVLDLAALGASLNLINATGIQNVFIEAQRLARRLSEGLANLGYVIHSRGPVIVNFAAGSRSPRESMAEIVAALSKAKVAFAQRAPGVRLSPHAFNEDHEIDLVIRALS